MIEVMIILFLIFGALIKALIEALWQNKKFRTIFDVYWNRCRRWWIPKLIKNQNSSFLKKHVDSAMFIRNLHFNGWYARLTPAQADKLNKHLKQCYKVPEELPELPVNVTILLPQPDFNSYNRFFGDCYYTKDAVPFYVYETQKNRVVEYNQQLFVCFTDTERKPLEVHMCDQRFFTELLEDYNYNCKILRFIFCGILLSGVCHLLYA